MAAPLPLALQTGEQGPAQQLTQVAGSSGNVDPGTSVPGTVLRSPALPTAAPSDNLAAAGGVATGTSGRADLPHCLGHSTGPLWTRPGLAAAATRTGGAPPLGRRPASRWSSPTTDTTALNAGTVLSPTSGAAAHGGTAVAAPVTGSGQPDVMLAGGGERARWRPPRRLR